MLFYKLDQVVVYIFRGSSKECLEFSSECEPKLCSSSTHLGHLVLPILNGCLCNGCALLSIPVHSLFSQATVIAIFIQQRLSLQDERIQRQIWIIYSTFLFTMFDKTPKSTITKYRIMNIYE